jgi:hypothetical protein
MAKLDEGLKDNYNCQIMATKTMLILNAKNMKWECST